MTTIDVIKNGKVIRTFKTEFEGVKRAEQFAQIAANNYKTRIGVVGGEAKDPRPYWFYPNN